MKFDITFLDGSTQEANIIPADTVAFERKFNMGAAQADANPHIEHAMFMAYTSLRRVGKAGDDFDAWLNTVEDIDPQEEVPLAQPGG